MVGGGTGLLPDRSARRVPERSISRTQRPTQNSEWDNQNHVKDHVGVSRNPSVGFLQALVGTHKEEIPNLAGRSPDNLPEFHRREILPLGNETSKPEDLLAVRNTC